MLAVRCSVFAGLLLLVIGCRPAAEPMRAPTGAVPTLAPFTPADATNALERVAALLALGPREAGTPGAARAAQWLAAQLRASGLADARVESFDDPTPDGTSRFHNVLAEWPGFSQEWLVLMSHFDAKSGIGTAEKPFAGANDGGSSSGLLLQLADLIVRSGTTRMGVIFAFLDGEECRYGYSDRDGLHGSRHLARALKAQGRKIRAVILMDMIGDRDLHITIPRNTTPALQTRVLDSAAALGLRSRFSLLDGAITDDHQPFLDAGFPAVNLIDFSYGPPHEPNGYWHTPEDSLDKLSAESLYVTGRVMMEIVRRLQADPP